MKSKFIFVFHTSIPNVLVPCVGPSVFEIEYGSLFATMMRHDLTCARSSRRLWLLARSRTVPEGDSSSSPYPLRLPSLPGVFRFPNSAFSAFALRLRRSSRASSNRCTRLSGTVAAGCATAPDDEGDGNGVSPHDPPFSAPLSCGDGCALSPSIAPQKPGGERKTDTRTQKINKLTQNTRTHAKTNKRTNERTNERTND